MKKLLPLLVFGLATVFIYTQISGEKAINQPETQESNAGVEKQPQNESENEQETSKEEKQVETSEKTQETAKKTSETDKKEEPLAQEQKKAEKEEKITEKTEELPQYLQTKKWTPVFGAENIELTLKTAGTDSEDQKQYWQDGVGEHGWNPDDGLQFIAPPNTIFSVINAKANHIWEVTCETCNYKGNLFIAPQDFELFTHKTEIPTQLFAQKQLPTPETMLEKIQQMADANIPYGWGGNTPFGEELDINSALGSIQNYGVDCSGLLFHATDGNTPRNTSELISFGQAVEIEGKTATEIAKIVKPMDIIVWKGHMMLVTDANTITESRYMSEKGEDSGVQTKDLVKGLESLMKDRTPANVYSETNENGKNFVIRRFL